VQAGGGLTQGLDPAWLCTARRLHPGSGGCCPQPGRMTAAPTAQRGQVERAPPLVFGSCRKVWEWQQRGAGRAASGRMSGLQPGGGSLGSGMIGSSSSSQPAGFLALSSGIWILSSQSAGCEASGSGILAEQNRDSQRLLTLTGLRGSSPRLHDWAAAGRRVGCGSGRLSLCVLWGGAHYSCSITNGHDSVLGRAVNSCGTVLDHIRKSTNSWADIPIPT
jgi:hypothetical protein